jgi:FkbM family methyltransferase
MHGLDTTEEANIARHAELLRRLEVEEPVIHDVGANSGAVTRAYLQQVPSATVHLFEPNPTLSDVLGESHDRRVTVYPIALGSVVGSTRFHIYADDTVSSVLEVDDRLAQSSANYDIARVIEVPMTTLDALCMGDAPSVPLPNLLKVDTQGFDLEVLRGASGVLSSRPPALIHIEMTVATQYEGQPSFHEVWGFLASHGYRLYDFERLVHTSRGNLYYGDVLFLSSQAWQELGLL